MRLITPTITMIAIAITPNAHRIHQNIFADFDKDSSAYLLSSDSAFSFGIMTDSDAKIGIVFQ